MVMKNYSWEEFLQENKKLIKPISKYIHERRADGYEIYPEDVFRAFEITPFKDTKVVILGQDPYHGKDQANGLAFSVNRDKNVPRSLKNIFKELKLEYDHKIPDHGDLSKWASQGVLLFNTCLTVEKGKPGSHLGKGWEEITDKAIIELATRGICVFMLWGRHAQKKKKLIEEYSLGNDILILEASHPGTLSATKSFFGCNHFKKANEWLKEWNKDLIDWRIE